MIIIESIVVIFSVIGLVWSGIIIGRECGSLKEFIIQILAEAQRNIDYKKSLITSPKRRK